MSQFKESDKDYIADGHVTMDLTTDLACSFLTLSRYVKDQLANLWSKTIIVKVLNTKSKLHDHFSWLCVELDLSKPLSNEVIIHREVQRVEYESLYTICFGCEKYGHLQEAYIHYCQSPMESGKEKELDDDDDGNQDGTTGQTQAKNPSFTYPKP